MRRALLVLLLVLSGCAPVAKPTQAQGTLCVWPDPIIFNTSSDSWRVCFNTLHGGSTPICVTVGELRTILSARQGAE